MTDAVGHRRPEDHASEYNAIVFVFKQLISRIATVDIVRIKKVTNNGGLSPVGFVDVEPLVNQMTGDDTPQEHDVIYNLPYFRLQGGTDAIIIDPKVGDLGMCGFCRRDISSVKKTKTKANPSSHRMFDWADGIYFGGILNGTPTQYVQFQSTGITINSPNKVTVVAPEIDLNASTKVVITTPECDVVASTTFKVTSPNIQLLGDTTIAGGFTQAAGGSGGAVSVIGPVTVTNDLTAQGKSLHNHTHSDPQGGSTGPPT